MVVLISNKLSPFVVILIFILICIVFNIIFKGQMVINLHLRPRIVFFFVFFFFLFKN
jgi:hypothetical protein